MDSLRASTIKPSDILLVGIPLTATFEKAEAEVAAAIMVRACQLNGDRWQALVPHQLNDAVQNDVEKKIEPLCSISRNPFLRPDFNRLLDRALLRWTGGVKTPLALEFTEDGLARLEGSRWNIARGKPVTA